MQRIYLTTYRTVFYLYSDHYSTHTETSQLVFTANQWTGFCVSEKLVLNEVRRTMLKVNNRNPKTLSTTSR